MPDYYLGLPSTDLWIIGITIAILSMLLILIAQLTNVKTWMLVFPLFYIAFGFKVSVLMMFILDLMDSGFLKPKGKSFYFPIFYIVFLIFYYGLDNFHLLNLGFNYTLNGNGFNISVLDVLAAIWYLGFIIIDYLFVLPIKWNKFLGRPFWIFILTFKSLDVLIEYPILFLVPLFCLGLILFLASKSKDLGEWVKLKEGILAGLLLFGVCIGLGLVKGFFSFY
jgi:hypothetical protein